MAKAVRVWYWITTVLFALFMLYSGIASFFPTEQGIALFAALGYPLYLNTILGAAKILGSIAILQTKYKTVKEWAYAGFTFDILGATLSFAFAGLGATSVLMMLPFLVVLVASYTLWKRAF